MKSQPNPRRREEEKVPPTVAKHDGRQPGIWIFWSGAEMDPESGFLGTRPLLFTSMFEWFSGWALLAVCRVARARLHVCSASREQLWLNVLLFIQAADLTVQLSSGRLTTTPAAPKSFGAIFTDHMLTIEWSEGEGWGVPRIQPLGNLSMHPACTSLHYGIQVPQEGPLFVLRITTASCLSSAFLD